MIERFCKSKDLDNSFNLAGMIYQSVHGFKNPLKRLVLKCREHKTNTNHGGINDERF